MVRLKVVGDQEVDNMDSMFQFHNGSIKREEALSAEIKRLSFNSTMVRLKEEGYQSISDTIESFNSTMVRLKARKTSCVTAGTTGFQFHNGSIKRDATGPITLH